jgi:hypothetical protein
MTHWKKVLVAASTGATLVVMATVAASASGPGRAAMRAAGTHVVLAASTSTGNGQPHGGVASGPGLGPIVVSIGDRWTLQGQLIVKGSVTITCGPFLPNQEGSSNAQVTVEEALGDHVGHALGSLTSVTCDGARHTYPVTALVSDVPFRPADGAASASANACGQDPSSFQFVCQSGTAIAPITVR